MAAAKFNEERDFQTQVMEVATQYQFGLLGLPNNPVQLSWKIQSAAQTAAQLGFQIQVSSQPDFSIIDFESEVSDSDQQLGVLAPGGNFGSGEERFYRVRIRTNRGWTDWSKAVSAEAGLLATEDWFGLVAVGDNSPMESPSPALRSEIHLASKPKRARLYVTSMGLNEFFINGVNVSDAFLSPGWTAYQERLLVETHDVTNLLTKGQNALAAMLSDGWWRGRFGFMEQAEHYGKDIGLLAKLVVEYADGSTQSFGTDENWKTTPSEIQFSSIYDGTTIDQNKAQTGWKLTGFDDSKWAKVAVKPLELSTLMQRITNPVRQVGEFALSIEQMTDRVLLRGVQNISGWVRLTVDGKKGQTVVVRHAEMLEPGNALHTKALRSAKATDTYILGHDGRHVLEPRFTFHGFQHADVVTDAQVISAVAVAISSDNARRGYFASSDTRLNRLHENVVWSQLDNFVSVPTDCPQRDERLGWTGDAQAFANTSNTLFAPDNFWKSWLVDLELDQFENGDVGAIVPDILKHAPTIPGWILEGRAGWADAATIVPMSVYEYFGDSSVLEQQLGSMRRWTNALDNRRAGNKFLPTEFQFGDWCDPDAPGDRPWESKVSADFVANCFFANTASLMARAEELVGDPELAEHYTHMASQLRTDIWDSYAAEALTTTAGCAIAIEFDIVPAAQKQQVADKLASMVNADKGKITTGFLATPLILHALSKNGNTSAAYQMLMRREFRSWLYAVDKGATTMWERWDAIQEDGSIHSGAMDTNPEGQNDASMISFNHYAYGAVVDWIYRNVGGLAPNLDNPGYRVVTVAPKPAAGFTFATTSINSGFGEISLDWRLDDAARFVAALQIPFGVTAKLDLPVSPNSVVTSNGEPSSATAVLGYGNHRITVTNPQIVSY